MSFRRRGHRGRGLAGGQTDHASLRYRAQMRRQHDVGVCGGDGGIEDRAQQRASVGHGLTGSGITGLAIGISDAGYPSDWRKRKPPRRGTEGLDPNNNARFRNTKRQAAPAAGP
jgi:hypothetical protein